MTDEVIQDLKQFITAMYAQQMSGVENRLYGLDQKVYRLDVTLNQKIDDLSSSVADALESLNSATETTIKDHTQRITKLEQKAV